MSKNRFLKSNNRFDSLDYNDGNKTSSNNNKNIHNYNSSNNSFIKKDSNPSIKDSNNKPYNDNKNDKKYSNNDNNKFKSNAEKSNEFTLNDELFPSLTPVVALTNHSTHFKDALKQTTNNQYIQKDTLKPGWIQIKKDTIFNKKTDNVCQQNYNIIMNEAINKMEQKWYKDRIIYNGIHGEGAYEDLYYLSPVYGSEYDTDSDIDDCEYLSEEEFNDNIYVYEE